jgi:hypothetical protein
MGGDGWVVEGKLTSEVPLDLYAWKGVQSAFGQRFNDTAGTGTAQQRLREQDEDGLYAEVLYPSSSSRWWRDIRDDEAYKAVLRGYNDWLAHPRAEAVLDTTFPLYSTDGTMTDQALQAALDVELQRANIQRKVSISEIADRKLLLEAQKELGVK